MGGLILSCFLITASTHFPGPWTLSPAVSTIVFIYTGTANTSLAHKGFGLRPATLVGDWSYSPYLWHWPVIFMAIAIIFRSAKALLIAALISLPLASTSYHGVEQPIRNMRSVSKPVPTSLISSVILISAASAGFALFVYQTLSVHQGNTGVS
jgi:peptidoglycan/LPS O-acetylase OafA/YrhL